MNLIRTALPGVLLIEPRIFRDLRGWFFESWSAERYREAGIPGPFVQDNVSRSSQGVLRGLHYQNPQPQGKLVSVLQGEVFDVAVDIREGSATFGHWVGYLLSSENGRQLYVPEGFAHGFVVTSETAIFSYKCTDYYRPDAEGSIRWDDPDLGIVWPVESLLLSDKDRQAPMMKELVGTGRLPQYAVSATV